jgi:di/tricarboxylate transporter
VLGGWNLRHLREQLDYTDQSGKNAPVLVGATAPQGDGPAPTPRTVVESVHLTPGTETGIRPSSRPTVIQVTTLAALTGLVVCVGVLRWDLGMTALLSATLLMIFLRAPERSRVLPGVSWEPIVLLTGMLTFMALAEQLGMIDWIAQGLLAFATPLVGLLLACYIAGAISALASSFATLAVILPVALTLAQEAEIGPVGATLVAAAIVVASTIVDISPFSTHGAMILSAAEKSEQTQFRAP